MPSEDYFVMEYSKLKNILNDIPIKRDRILLKTIYAGCARVGEVVNHRYDKKRKHITATNFSYGPNFLVIELHSEKSMKHRRVPIARKDLPGQEFFKRGEGWLSEDLILNASGVSFAMSTRLAEKIFEKHFGVFECRQHIHWLRHWRATHLLSGVATGVALPDRVVAKIGGWSGTATLTRVYDASVIEDYLGVDYNE